MGAFYDNLLVQGSRDDVLARARASFSRGLVGPEVEGWVAVAPDLEDPRYASGVSHMAEAATVLCADVHDDDILTLRLLVGGVTVATYDSSPGYFDFDGELDEIPGPELSGQEHLLASLPVRDEAALLETLTYQKDLSEDPPHDDRYVFESERHYDVLTHAGLPTYACQFGWRYGARGEFPRLLAAADVERF